MKCEGNPKSRAFFLMKTGEKNASNERNVRGIQRVGHSDVVSELI